MEDIYTIKVRSNPDPRSLYPSERRYSASTVLGLGVVHLALATTVLLLASLSLTTHNLKEVDEMDNYNSSASKTNVSDRDMNDRNSDMAFLDEDFESAESNYEDLGYNHFLCLTLMPSFMTIGAIAAGITGLLAWKRWYIDYNIRWFFLMSSFSIITALICLIMACLAVGAMIEHKSITMQNTFIFTFSSQDVILDRVDNDPHSIQSKIFSKSSNKPPNLRLVLGINLVIASFLELIWSILSAKVSFFGMRNSYPDDIILSRGQIEVNTVHKGNKFSKAVAPDILNHHPKKKKFVKYFPKIENGFLPKQESCNEYRDRVNKFLSGNADSQ